MKCYQDSKRDENVTRIRVLNLLITIVQILHEASPDTATVSDVKAMSTCQ